MNKIQLSDERFQNISRILIFGTMTGLGYWLTQKAVAYIPVSTKYPMVISILYPFLFAAVMLTAFVKGRPQKEVINNIVLFSVWPGLFCLLTAGVFYLLLVSLHLPEWAVDGVLYLSFIGFLVFEISSYFLKRKPRL